MNKSIYAISIPLLVSMLSNSKGSANQSELINVINNGPKVNKHKNLVAKNILMLTTNIETFQI